MSKPYVVGIAGGSASGKSTLCDRLEQAMEGLRIRVFHMDEYFRGDDERPFVPAPVTGVCYLDDNHPQSMDLPRLGADLCAARTQDYDVVLVEGLLTLYDDGINGQLDLRLFVDCRADERIVRRLRRNMAWGLSFDEVANVYLDMVRYRHDEYVEPSKWRADLIINGSAPSESALAALTGLIRQRVLETRDA